MTTDDCQLGVLGAGSAARAVVGGIIRSGLLRPEQVLVTNRDNIDRREALARDLGVRTSDRPADVARARTILVMTKPSAVAEALSPLRLGRSHLLISVAAGVPIDYIQRCCGPSVPIIRAMPNLCCQVRAGVTVITPGNRVRPRHLLQARALFGALGEVLELPESMLDAVTATSGSGPAYVSLLCELLAEAGTELGLPREVAVRLAGLVVMGTGRLLAEGWDPAAVRTGVSSPGGTTVAALSVLDQRGFAPAFRAAVGRAAKRSAELTRLLPTPDAVSVAAGPTEK